MKSLSLLCSLMLAGWTSMFSLAHAQSSAIPASAPATQPASIPLYTAWPFDAAEAARRQDETAKALGIQKELTVNLGHGASMKLALIPPGTFTMGSPKEESGRNVDEGPQHDVTITRPFLIGVYPVTQQQYQQVLGKNPSQFKAPANPVEMMSWDDAVEFCKTASKTSGKVVRLPTEAQWEYACRAGAATRFFFGEDEAKLADYAWYNANSANKTHPVGQKKPNPWGLYDMNGNVWQWCADWIGTDYYAASPKDDPQGPPTGTFRSLRGGSWPSAPSLCRCACRLWNVAAHRSGKIGSFGFRVVVETTSK